MKDTISEGDLLIDVTKVELERRLDKAEKENKILHERVDNMDQYLQKIMAVADKMQMEVKT